MGYCCACAVAVNAMMQTPALMARLDQNGDQESRILFKETFGEGQKAASHTPI